MTNYPVVITPLSEDDGGGFLGHVPDLQGCFSDGETPEEALRNTYDAIEEWIDAYAAKYPGRELPAPGSMAARAARQREKMSEVIRRLSSAHELMGEQIDELARRIEEIQDQIDHMEQWARFGALTGEIILEVESGDLGRLLPNG